MSVGLRRLRGALGMSVLWTLLWLGIFAVLAGLTAVLDPDSLDEGEGVGLALIAAAIGATAGIAFALLLAVTGRGRGVAELSVIRAAGCGAPAAALFPLLVGKPDQALIMAVVGALLGAGLAALARRAARRRAGRRMPVALMPLHDIIGP